jgi:hypothetical protein
MMIMLNKELSLDLMPTLAEIRFLKTCITLSLSQKKGLALKVVNLLLVRTNI